jgi:signal peptide peptidase SppA
MLPSSLEHYLKIIEDRNDGLFELAVKADKRDKKQRYLQYNLDTGVGVLPVIGALTYIEYEAMCGDQNSSYQQIKEEFDALAEAGAKTIVMDVDGPGGEAYSCFETASYLRTEADKKGIKLLAYVDGLAASATYGITSAAHEVIANPMAEVGSIGVVVKLRNMNKAMREMGVEDTYVYAGNSKIPFDAEGAFRQDFLDDIQQKVDVLYQGFIDHVSQMRGISQDVVKGTEAKTFLAEEAMSLGLIDKVMTREGFFEYLADRVETGDKMLGKYFKTEKQEEVLEMKELAELQEKYTALETELVSAKAVAASFEAVKTELEAKASLVAELQEKLASFEAEKVAFAEAAKLAKLEARKEKLAAVMSADEAASLSAKLEVVDDESFDAVYSSFKAKHDTLEKSPLFKAVGIDAESNGKVDALDTLITQKYKNK